MALTQKTELALDEKTFDRLELLGYGRQEITDIYLLAETVADESFIDHILKAEYRDAFRMDPKKLGNKTRFMLPAFAARLYLITDENGQYTEWEQFINDMLYRDEEYCIWNNGRCYVEDYIILMAEQSSLLRRNIIEQIPDGRVSKEESEWIANMNILWKTLYKLYKEGDILVPENGKGYFWYSRGKCCLQVKDLQIDQMNRIGLTLELCEQSQEGEAQEDDRVLNQEQICTSPVWGSLATYHAKALARIRKYRELRDLDQQTDRLWAEQTLNTALSVMNIFYPDAAEGIKAVVMALDENMNGTAGNFTNAEILEQFENEGSNSDIEGMLGMIKYFEETQKPQNEEEEDMRYAMIRWFYSADLYLIHSGDPVYLGEGICGYDTLQKIRMWNEQGCVAFVKHENLGEDAQEVMAGQIYEIIMSVSYEQEEVICFMIYGANDEEHKTLYKSILDIEEQLFLESIDRLDLIIKNVTHEEADTLDYWWDWENPGEEE